MKFKLILIFLVLIPSALAGSTISNYLDSVNSNFILLVEDTAPGSDSLAAADIATGIQRITSNNVILKSKLVSENRQLTNLILIGNPCDNKLIPIDCGSWPYQQGEALIQVSGSNLIVAGSTSDDTRRAAKIIANYKDYLELRQTDKIVVKGSSLSVSSLSLEEPTQEQVETANRQTYESKEQEKVEEKKEEQKSVAQEQTEKQEEEKSGFFKRLWRSLIGYLVFWD